jgi:hypothetical protein
VIARLAARRPRRGVSPFDRPVGLVGDGGAREGHVSLPEPDFVRVAVRASRAPLRYHKPPLAAERYVFAPPRDVDTQIRDEAVRLRREPPEVVKLPTAVAEHLAAAVRGMR